MLCAFCVGKTLSKMWKSKSEFWAFFVANISLDSLVFTSFPLQLNSRVLCHISFLYSLLGARSFIKLLIFSRKINDFFHLFPPEADFQESRVGKSQKSLINVAAVYFPKSYPPPTQKRVHAAEMCIAWNDKEWFELQRHFKREAGASGRQYVRSTTLKVFVTFCHYLQLENCQNVIKTLSSAVKKLFQWTNLPLLCNKVENSFWLPRSPWKRWHSKCGNVQDGDTLGKSGLSEITAAQRMRQSFVSEIFARKCVTQSVQFSFLIWHTRKRLTKVKPRSGFHDMQMTSLAKFSRPTVVGRETAVALSANQFEIV